MSKLIIYQGNDNYFLEPVDDDVVVYQIGGGKVLGSFKILNDHKLLNKYAKELTKSYSEWVYSHNQFFLKYGMVSNGLSLFFLSDFSCKRSEIFETYSVVCNLFVLKDQLKECSINNVEFIGVTNAFIVAFHSIFPELTSNANQLKSEKINIWRRWFSDIRYLVEITLVILINKFLRVKPNVQENIKKKKFFFSSYPLMFDQEDVEEKYKDFVSAEDVFAVSVVTDGLHQHVNPLQYYSYRKKLLFNKKFHVLDDFLQFYDVCIGLYWLLKLNVFSRFGLPKAFIFQGINITDCVKIEWRLSFSRISRLMVLKGPFQRFFAHNNVSDVIYYLHEFPYGRLLTYVLGEQSSDINRIGFQHGPASWRKLFYFMSKNEGTLAPPYMRQAPIPDAVLAEDSASLEIYQNAGYKSISVMDRVYRLDNLDDLKLSFDQAVVLIAPGLHDAKLMLTELRLIIQKNKHITYLLKLHPRANKEALDIDSIENLMLTDEPVQRLYERVGKVYVTYSSVGMEANKLGLEVELVNIPGVINESPLLDVNG